MKIGYIHIDRAGAPESGLKRYGRILAEEAGRTTNVDIMESTLQLGESKRANIDGLISLSDHFKDCDIIHMQHSPYHWNIARIGFLRRLKPKLVVTLHDVYATSYLPLSKLPIVLLKYLFTTLRGFPAGTALRRFIEYAKNLVSINFSLRLILIYASRLVVSNDVEVKRLTFLRSHKIRMVPHFVENRTLLTTPAKARDALGLSGKRVVTLLGYIFPTKGHELLVRAIPSLPLDVLVIFAGSFARGSEGIEKKLQALIREYAVSPRLLITGYLTDDDLNTYISATHLAVCPFLNCSASGSLSTWISAAKPILASDLELFNEYNTIESESIEIFSPIEPGALAARINEILPSCDDATNPRVLNLASKLSLKNTFAEYCRIFKETS